MTATQTATVPHHDRLLRFERDLEHLVPKGCAFYDWLPRVPRPNIARVFGVARNDGDMKVFDCEPGTILPGGGAVGFDRRGRIQLIRPWNNDVIGFCGFVEKTIASGRVVVRVRGQVALVIPGGGKAGSRVFCTNPNEFGLTRDGHEVGQILFTQPENQNLCCISFKAFNDPNPLDLNLGQHRGIGWVR